MPDTRPLGKPAPESAPAAPRRFRDWSAGRPVDTTLRRDIPRPLVPVLRHWIALACEHDGDVAQRAALRLDIAPKPGGRGQFSFLTALQDVGKNPDLLDVINAILAVHRAPAWFHTNLAEVAGNYTNLVAGLRDALEDAGSAYTVDDTDRRLIERVDPTVAAAVQQTIDTAPSTAADLLREAWNQTYGLHPDPTAAYCDAVRAVEEVACPLVLAKAAANNSASLGTVRNHLRDAPDKWQFALLDKDGDGSVGPLVAMLDRLWTGQVSRHGGGENSRGQTTEEAQAAVHLAATLVQLLGGGALTRRATS